MKQGLMLGGDPRLREGRLCAGAVTAAIGSTLLRAIGLNSPKQ
jgi:hypothetical protein